MTNENTTTISILVTHIMGILNDIINRVKGELIFNGDPEDGIVFYNQRMG